MTETQESALRLRYAGLSTYEADGEDEASGTQNQHVCLFTDQMRGRGRTQLCLKNPLAFREGLRTLIELNGLRSSYQPEGSELYEAYSTWRRSLSPSITPVETTQAFFAFLAEHDPTAWLGCDPTLSLDDSGLHFELLDPTGRVYGALSLPSSGYDLISRQVSDQRGGDQSGDSGHGEQISLCTQFEAGVTLRESLSMINNASPLMINIGARSTEVNDGCRGAVEKVLPTPSNWQRNFTQLLSASTLNMRRVSLSRMDLYNVLQQLRLHADVPKAKKGIRFELIPGKPPALTLEPWGWRLIGSGDVYRGGRAEIIGIWDRRDLLVFDSLLPYVEEVEICILGEAQPTFWVLHCGSFTFTLGTMGFRPSNWSRGVLLDISLPRLTDSGDSGDQIVGSLSQGPLTLEELQQTTGAEEATVLDQLRAAIQAGRVAPDFAQRTFRLRTLFTALDTEGCRYRNEREARAHELTGQDRVVLTLGELPTGELEIQGLVSEPKASHMPTEPVYTPQFQIKEGAGMRKMSCDCAWMKDREKQKIGPCPHVQALWLRYSLDEAKRQAEILAHPERVEVATSVYIRRRGEGEQSRQISFKKRSLDEYWEDTGAAPRRFHRVFHSIAAARAAYFKRVADLELRDFMDASQS